MMATTPSNILLLILFVMLTGCTAPSLNIEPAKTKQTKHQSSTENNKPSTPCVYESTKGVAEVIKISPQQVTFKFYPGDQIFSLKVNALSNADISLHQELKAFIRTPLSGPCTSTEFELLSTVE